MTQLDLKPETGIWSWGRAGAFLLLSVFFVFAHGCHGDEDHELFGWLSGQESGVRQATTLDP